MLSTFGQDIADDRLERCDRFIEEALELVQAVGYSPDRVAQLTDYVFNRPAGEPEQELGGVVVTLGALASAVQLDLDFCADKELVRCWANSDTIREKQKHKPRYSPLPA